MGCYEAPAPSIFDADDPIVALSCVEFARVRGPRDVTHSSRNPACLSCWVAVADASARTCAAPNSPTALLKRAMTSYARGANELECDVVVTNGGRRIDCSHITDWVMACLERFVGTVSRAVGIRAQ